MSYPALQSHEAVVTTHNTRTKPSSPRRRWAARSYAPLSSHSQPLVRWWPPSPAGSCWGTTRTCPVKEKRSGGHTLGNIFYIIFLGWGETNSIYIKMTNLNCRNYNGPTFTVHSIQTPWLFPHFVTLQLYSKMDYIERKQSTHNTHNDKATFFPVYWE